MKLYDWLKVAPYQADEQIIDDDEFSSARGIRVMGVAYSTERQVVTLIALSVYFVTSSHRIWVFDECMTSVCCQLRNLN
jgi:hypothetical protein